MVHKPPAQPDLYYDVITSPRVQNLKVGVAVKASFSPWGSHQFNAPTPRNRDNTVQSSKPPRKILSEICPHLTVFCVRRSS
ncbi:Uncharacterized protein TCM_007968 [Theobroma cacao]|uniref:Uncharacterized protein n=1 Tax=Theobroma cacao TaxID=3641 RepID=A0A061E3X5_THECC|nr:Uncharacterized protein TCM_007968 [Theobroma cacao]